MIANLTRNTTIASHVEIAQDPLSRMKGLLGKNDFPKGEALVITHCQSIHMFFMKFPIDVIFCDRQDKSGRPLFRYQTFLPVCHIFQSLLCY
jgi:uncharacterized membrane protein (UPF0127 family)